MEYLKGEIPNELFFSKKKLSERELFKIATGLLGFLTALRHAKRPILYLDWKPENLLITEDGVKIVDFGSAMYEDEADCSPGLSTAGFSAPELTTGRKIEAASDIYGFGALLSFFSENTREDRRKLFSRSFVKEVSRLSEVCMAERPEKRCTLRKIEKVLASRKSGRFKKENRREEIFFVGGGRVIGIAGAYEGAGATYLSVKIVKRLSEKRKKVAYLTTGKEEGEEEFRTVFEEKGRGRIFCKSVSFSEIPSIVNEAFDHIVIDFGRMEREIEGEFFRTDKKIIVFSYDDIRKYCTDSFLRKYRTKLSVAGMNFVVNFCEGREVSELKAKLDELSVKGEITGISFEKPEI